MPEEKKKSAVQVLMEEITKLRVSVATLTGKVDNLTVKTNHQIIRSESLLKAILGLETVPDLSKMVSGKPEVSGGMADATEDEVKMEELTI